MDFLLNLLIGAAILFGLAYVLPQVHIKSFWTALWVAFLISLLNATLGFLLRLPLNLVTLGLLTFFVRLIVLAVMIKLVDKLVRNFKVDGFWPALLIAVVMSIATTLIDTSGDDENREVSQLEQVRPQTAALYAQR